MENEKKEISIEMNEWYISRLFRKTSSLPGPKSDLPKEYPSSHASPI